MSKKSYPLVSIICPTFNSGIHLGEAIDSVIDQTYENWELILVDGGSTDNTSILIENYKKNCCRIRSYSYSARPGPGPARSFAINMSKGAYIAFLDSDDFWLPNKLKSQLNFLLRKKIGFCYTKYDILRDGILSSGPVLWNSVSYNSYFKKRGICNSTVVISKKIIKPVLSSFSYTGFAEDTMLWLLVMKKGENAFLLPEPNTIYRVSKAGRSQNILKNAMAVIFIYRKVFRVSLLNVALYYPSYVLDVIVRTHCKTILKLIFSKSIN